MTRKNSQPAAKVKVRQATRADIPELMALNRRAYPTLAEDNVVCYDIEFPEISRLLADEGAEIVFVPFCTDNRQGYLRVRYCAAARAIENQVYVALADNVGNLPDVVNMDVQYGQAAVLTPSDFDFARDGIAAEADSNEETVLICDVDLDVLETSRSNGTVTPRLDRRVDLFQVTSVIHAPAGKPSTFDGPRGDQPGDKE